MSDGWLRIRRKDFDALRLESSLTIVGRNTFTDQDISVALFQEETDRGCDYVRVPRGIRSQLDQWGISYDVYEATWDRSRARSFSRLSSIRLRDYQEAPVRALEGELRAVGGGILQAGCGTGKTVMSLEIARRLGQGILVLVHREFLMEQWQKEIKRFLPEAKVGIWRDKTYATGKECDFVIAMVQSVTSKRQYPKDLYESFGLVICDEAHRYAAPIWQEAIVKFPAKYRLGLTATPNRKDGLQEVFKKHIGRIAYQIEGEALLPKVYKIPLDTQLDGESYMLRNGKPNTSALMTMLSEDLRRTAEIVPYIVRAVNAGRRVLVLTSRRSHASELELLAKNRLEKHINTCLFLGGISPEQRALADDADLIVGTYQMIQDAFNVPHLDTLMLVTPQTSITQAVGRILREAEGKPQPIVLDFVDENVSICLGYAKARMKKYKNMEYELVGF